MVFLCHAEHLFSIFHGDQDFFFISNCPYCSITSKKKLAARNPPKFNTHKKSANSICEGFWLRSSYIGGSHEQAFYLFPLDLDVRGLRDEGGGMRKEDSDSDSEESDSGSHVLIIKFVRTLHICSIL